MQLNLIGNQRKQFYLVLARKRQRRNSWHPYWWQVTTRPHLSCQVFLCSFFTWFIKRSTVFFLLRPSLLACLSFKTWACRSKNSSIILWFLSWRDEGDKTYLIAPEVRYVAWPVSAGLRRIFYFLTNQRKVQMLDYGQTTSKLNVSGIRPFVKITTLLWVASKRGHETKKHVLTEGCQTWCVFLPNIWSLTAVKANCRTKGK